MDWVAKRGEVDRSLIGFRIFEIGLWEEVERIMVRYGNGELKQLKKNVEMWEEIENIQMSFRD